VIIFDDGNAAESIVDVQAVLQRERAIRQQVA
jgi:hypothetical protein